MKKFIAACTIILIGIGTMSTKNFCNTSPQEDLLILLSILGVFLFIPTLILNAFAIRFDEKDYYTVITIIFNTYFILLMFYGLWVELASLILIGPITGFLLLVLLIRYLVLKNR
jgi:hypothetical protein